MAIVGTNSLLNSYVPSFSLTNILNGQILVYDSYRKSFINKTIPSGSTPGATKLGELLNVSSTVDDTMSLQNKQALTFNTTTGLWENTFVDYNSLLNKPTTNGTVTSVALSGGTTGLTISGSPITSNGTITISGTLAIANGGTGGTTSTTAINSLLPSQTGNSGKVLSTNGTSISWAPVTSGSGSTEYVILRYSAGNAGNFVPSDVIYSQTAGVTTTITDAANCIVSFAFTGKTNVPSSVLTYGQAYAFNTFTIKDCTSLPLTYISSGGSSSAPSIITTGFTSSDLLSLQLRMTDTGSSAGVGERAWLIIIFKF